MPLYEYQCDACGSQFELIRKFSDPPVQVCPACGADGVRKLLSSPAFQFKGSGWYVTDYARKAAGESGAGTAATAEGKGDTKGGAKDSVTPATAKTDSAPAAAEKPSDKPAAPAGPAAPAKDK
jgi:putative FmdB family regulatory protein